MTKDTTPIGLWIIIALFVIGGLYGPYGWYFEDDAATLSILTLLFGWLFSFGLFKRLNFVRILTIIIVFIPIPLDIVWLSVVNNPFMEKEVFLYNAVPKIFSLLLSLWMIFYLTMPSIKTLFGKATNQTSDYNRPYFFIGSAILISCFVYFILSGHFARVLVPAILGNAKPPSERIGENISYKERSFKAGEKAEFSFKKPLAVLSPNSNICIRTNLRIKMPQSMSYKNGEDALYKLSVFKAEVTTSEGKKYQLSPENYDEYQKEGHFSDNFVMTACADLEIPPNTDHPRDIAHISITAQRNFTAYNISWSTEK